MGIQVDSREPGVVVASTSSAGGARAAGLEGGDRILAINGIEVGSFPSLQEQLSKHRPGDEVRVSLEREQQRRDVVVTLTNRQGAASLAPPKGQPEPTKAAPQIRQLETAWGVTLSPVPDRIRERLQLRGGVMVTGLQRRMGTARHPQRLHCLAHRRLAGKGPQNVARVVARAAKTTKRDSCSKACIPMAAEDLRALPSLDVRP